MDKRTSRTLIELERKFWQSMVNQDTDTATGLLNEPALMVSPMGSIKFNHDGYRRMAEQGSSILTAFELSNVDVLFPNEGTAIVTYKVKQDLVERDSNKATTQEMNDTSTWIHDGEDWRCVMHTETPVKSNKSAH
jgi:hypothetical protein